MNLLAQPQEGRLENGSLLRKVFGYVGKGQSCFMRANRQWNDIYMKLYGAKATYDAPVASASRFEVAAAEGCPLTEKLFTRAAGNGSLGVCRKLQSLSRTPPWSRRACAAAAKGGHLELL
ncbi:unnamed protein product [Chrysoparadoxa australica]